MAEHKDVAALKQKAIEVRKNILKMIYTAQSGHPGGSLSAADMMTALYFHELNVDPENPGWDDRDRFVLSKGHVCPVLYTCLGMRGYFDEKELLTLRKEGSILQGHPDMKRCPGIDISTGSLGQGLSVGVGMAIRAKRDGKSYRVYVLIGDGEAQEGQIWEAVQAAAKYELDNLTILVDNNNLQNDNCCDVVMPTGDLAKKFEAFGCSVQKIDGHDMEQILSALAKARLRQEGKPNCIVMSTLKGRGVSFMENVVKWHGVAPNESEYAQAVKEVEAGLQ
jgi:transketolase